MNYVTRDYMWALKAEDKCLDAACRAKNEKFKQFWNDVANEIEQKYLIGQPWLRTYDGKVG